MKVRSIQPIAKRKLRLWILSFAISLGFFSFASSSWAVDYYWDTTAGLGNGTGGNGTFTTATNLWSLTAAGDATLVANTGTTNDVSNFQGTAGTVSWSNNLIQGAFNINTNGYTFTTASASVRTLGIGNVTLGNNVNLNLSSYSTSGLKFQSNSISGGTGSSLTLTSSSGKRIVLLDSGATVASSAPIIFNITGTLAAGDYMALGNSSSIGTVNSTITGNSGANDMTFYSSGTALVLNGAVSGSQGVSIAGNGLSVVGRVELNASNSYAGKTTLNGGSVYVSNNYAFSTNSIVVASNTIIRGIGVATASQIANAIEFGTSGANLTIGADSTSSSISYNGIVSGSGSVTAGAKSGSYSVSLTNTNNTFTGGVSVNNGNILYVGNLGNKADAQSSIGTGATITLGSTATNLVGSLRWAKTSGNETSDKDFAIAGNATILANGATNASLTLSAAINSTTATNKTITFAGYNTNTLTINGLINEFTGTTNSVVIGGSSSGTVVLANTTNSFSGAITITNGTSGQNTVLSVANIGMANAVSPLGKNGTINFGNSSAGSLTTLKYTGTTGETSDKVINLASTIGGAILDQSGTGNLKFTSAITATAPGAKTITLQGSTGGTGELSGNISDLGNVTTLVKSGTGTWKLSGSNSYSGTTEIKLAGVLQVGSTNSLSKNSSLLGASSSAATATLDLSASGGGDYIANSYGVSTTGGFNMNFTNSSGSAATLRFTNANNYMTIATNNSAGRSLINQSSLLDVRFDGNIEIGSTSNSVVEFGGAGNFRVDGAIMNSGTAVRGLQKTGAGTLTLAGTGNNYNGTAVDGGTLEVGALGALPTASAITVSNGATLRFLKSSGGINVGAMTNSGTLEQNLVTITSSGAVNLTGSTLKVNGSPTEPSYILVTGNSLTGTPTLNPSIPNYQLVVSGNNVLLQQQIVKATPTIVAVPSASAITYGQTLANSTLSGGTGSVAGTFAFTTPSTSPNVGTANQGVTFTPNDTANYNTATTSVSVTVGKATPTISAPPTASGITYGQTLANSTLTGGTASTPGSFAFTTPSTSPNVGTANQGVTFTPADTANYNTATTSVSVTVTASAPTGLSYNSPSINATVGTGIADLTPAVTGSGITYSIDPALPTGLLLNPTTGVISGTPSVTSASAIYTVSATNLGGSTTTALTIGVGYALGPVAVDDALTKSGNNQPLLIPISDLLANDYRITNSSGARATDGDGLSVTAVTSGSGNTATLAGVFIQFTPSSASTDTFTYTVTDGTKTATATVTITTETQAPSFDLQIVKVGTATYSGGNTTVTHDFIGVPGQTYMVEYTTNLSGAWTSAGNQSTGVTGSFSMTITKSGDFVSEWNAHMFFRGRLVR